MASVRDLKQCHPHRALHLRAVRERRCCHRHRRHRCRSLPDWPSFPKPLPPSCAYGRWGSQKTLVPATLHADEAEPGRKR
eukprot:169915-Chlamydomonas_euryale.AAC.1